MRHLINSAAAARLNHWAAFPWPQPSVVPCTSRAVHPAMDWDRQIARQLILYRTIVCAQRIGRSDRSAYAFIAFAVPIGIGMRRRCRDYRRRCDCCDLHRCSFSSFKHSATEFNFCLTQKYLIQENGSERKRLIADKGDPSQVTSTSDADCHWLAFGRVIGSTFEPAFGSQNPAHASISLRRFSKASPRL